MDDGQVSQWRNFDLESGAARPAQGRLIGQGFSVLGPFLHAPEAIVELQQGSPTAALIDADIAHKRGHGDLLTELAQRKVPTVLTTDERIESTRLRFPDWPLVAKPFAPRHVEEIVLHLLAA
ncbi:response regulator [Sabulicella glaciei]|uniref:Response regulatory domain-containing protein n=1 Tax=Sabulicella glaciei TaxID=2984948 RepID=A0ABT3NU91_9PROT|nr:hypothetical protein [Roseococcus sp. MDT2-1-1]MCW8085726.1 hypothetical protein [Roseococcus sp. MDT2-1-1]